MTLSERIQIIQRAIKHSIVKFPNSSCRNPCLVAVSKGQPSTAIREAHAAGITNFAENYWQEAQEKLIVLQHLPLCWHFIGRVQTNKAALISQNFSWVHSLDKEKTAQLLSRHRPHHLPPLNLCIQINLDNEENKAGIAPENLLPLTQNIIHLPGIKLRGLMAIPKFEENEALQYQSLLRLNNLLVTLNKQANLSLDTLSMGMSGDLIAAIKAGSTILRIGRAIFKESF